MHSEFRIGRRLVQPELNTIVVSGKATRVEPKVMEVLVYLARRPGEVVGRETLIRDLWGDTFVTDAALTRCIAELRKVFDDDVRAPRVIQTIAKSGYRLIAPVEAAGNGDDAPQAVAPAEGEKTTGEVRARSRLFLSALAFGVAGLIVGAAAMFVFRRPVSPQTQQVLRTTLPLAGESLALDLRAIAMSPDGSRVAYVGGQMNSHGLFLRVLDSAAVTSVPESEGGWGPFFSPDSRWLGFWADGKLKKALVSDLSVVPICDTPGTAGASWGANGMIVFSSGGKLYRVSEAGGTPQLVAAPDLEARESGLYLPNILPSGDVVLATRVRLPGPDVVAVPLNGGRLKQVLSAAAGARYAPTGHLVYYRPAERSLFLALSQGRLMAAPFDPIRVEVTGASVMMAEEVSGARFDFGATGTLLYAVGKLPRFMLVWVDRTGAARQVGPVESYHQPALSPDGRRIAVTIKEDIWVYDLERETLTQVTFNVGYWPIWTPDGTRLTYVTTRNGALNVVWKNANGTGEEEQLTTSPHNQSASSWSSDGKLLVFQDLHPKTQSDIWLLDVGQGRKLRCFLCTDAFEGSPAFSPDGKWIAYTSFVSGPLEVYVRPVDGSEKKYPISNGTGRQPLWSRDGKELFYWKDQQIGSGTASMQMMAVDVTLGPVFLAGKPRALFAGSFREGGRANFDVTADGKRFLMLQPVQSEAITELQLVVNWFEELRARVRPTGR